MAAKNDDDDDDDVLILGETSAPPLSVSAHERDRKRARTEVEVLYESSASPSTTSTSMKDPPLFRLLRSQVSNSSFTHSYTCEHARTRHTPLPPLPLLLA